STNKTESARDTALWRIKKTVSSSESEYTNSSHIQSVTKPPKDPIKKMGRRPSNEFGISRNINYRLDILKMLIGITRLMQIKTQNHSTPNNIVHYLQSAITESKKKKKKKRDRERFKKINSGVLLCSTGFHLTHTTTMNSEGSVLGFINVSSSKALGSLSSKTKTVWLHPWHMEVPRKRGKKEQAGLRTSSLRMWKTHNIKRPVTDTMVQQFIGGSCNRVIGRVMDGSGDVRQEYSQTGQFNCSSKSLVAQLLQIYHGTIVGMNNLCEVPSTIYGNVSAVNNEWLFHRYFEEISESDSKYNFLVTDSFKNSHCGAVEMIVIYTNIKVQRYSEYCKNTEQQAIVQITPEQEETKSLNTQRQSTKEAENISEVPLLLQLKSNYRRSWKTFEV
uniref:Eukaryotic peptide chain release factor subunit 1 n=1 Tax=Sus scrofa TaxID=9823 RepID=A0A8D1PJE0_PIG